MKATPQECFDFFDYYESGEIQSFRRSIEGFVVNLKNGTIIEASTLREVIQKTLKQV